MIILILVLLVVIVVILVVVLVVLVVVLLATVVDVVVAVLVIVVVIIAEVIAVVVVAVVIISVVVIADSNSSCSNGSRRNSSSSFSSNSNSNSSSNTDVVGVLVVMVLLAKVVVLVVLIFSYVIHSRTALMTRPPSQLTTLPLYFLLQRSLMTSVAVQVGSDLIQSLAVTCQSDAIAVTDAETQCDDSFYNSADSSLSEDLAQTSVPTPNESTPPIPVSMVTTGSISTQTVFEKVLLTTSASQTTCPLVSNVTDSSVDITEHSTQTEFTDSACAEGKIEMKCMEEERYHL